MDSSLQDLIAIFLPHMTILACVLVIVSLAYDPTMTVFLYSRLPEAWKTWPWFLICLLEEVRSMTIMAAILIPTFQIHVIAIDLVNTSLQSVLSCAVKRLVSCLM